MIELTHLEVSRIAARWLLLRRFSNCATWEVGPDPHTLLGYQPPARFDAMGVKSVSSPKRGQGRIDIVEVKVSRADLLADFREKKSLKYFQFGSHVWLTVTENVVRDVLRVDPASVVDPGRGWSWLSDPAWRDAGIRYFDELGWPTVGGLLVVRPGKTRPYVHEWRLAKRHHQFQPTDSLIAKATERIATRYSHRMLDPIREPVESLGGPDVQVIDQLEDASTDEVVRSFFE